MDRREYDRWWQENTDDDGELLDSLPEPVATLAAHAQALQGRIDRLMDADDHDLKHGWRCRCYAVRCGCAYGHPDAVCMTHEAVKP